MEQRPLRAYWEITRACDLACRHCRAEAAAVPDPAELTTAEGSRLLQRLAAFGEPLPHLVLTGGDPLKRKDEPCPTNLAGGARALCMSALSSSDRTPSSTATTGCSPNHADRRRAVVTGGFPAEALSLRTTPTRNSILFSTIGRRPDFRQMFRYLRLVGSFVKHWIGAFVLLGGVVARAGQIPEVVATGKEPGVRACAECHAINGVGGSGSASLAGLSAEYISDQIANYRKGLRGRAYPRTHPSAMMQAVARAVDDGDLREAAQYFASLELRPWLRVVEADTVPTGGRAEPIGRRIVEMPEAQGRWFVADVPDRDSQEGRGIGHDRRCRTDDALRAVSRRRPAWCGSRAAHCRTITRLPCAPADRHAGRRTARRWCGSDDGGGGEAIGGRDAGDCRVHRVPHAVTHSVPLSISSRDLKRQRP